MGASQLKGAQTGEVIEVDDEEDNILGLDSESDVQNASNGNQVPAAVDQTTETDVVNQVQIDLPDINDTNNNNSNDNAELTTKTNEQASQNHVPELVDKSMKRRTPTSKATPGARKKCSKLFAQPRFQRKRRIEYFSDSDTDSDNDVNKENNRNVNRPENHCVDRSAGRKNSRAENEHVEENAEPTAELRVHSNIHQIDEQMGHQGDGKLRGEDAQPHDDDPELSRTSDQHGNSVGRRAIYEAESDGGHSSSDSSSRLEYVCMYPD